MYCVFDIEMEIKWKFPCLEWKFLYLEWGKFHASNFKIPEKMEENA